MIYRNFTLQLIIRLILIFGNMAVILYPNFKHPLQNVFFLTLIFFILLLIQIYSLFKYLRHSHELLNETLKMINAGNYAITSGVNKKFKSLDELYLSLNKTIDSFQKINTKFQSQHNYLKLLIENIDVGIISVMQSDKIDLINTAGKKLLGLEKINSLKDISSKHPILTDTIQKTNHSRHLLIELKNGETVQQISIKITSINMMGSIQKLITLHNISDDLARTETESWSRLLKVLNHEIFNSVTPLSSLSSTLNMIIKNEKGAVKSNTELSNEEIQDIAESIETIHLRSNNLMNFINGFKRLAKVPPPRIRRIKVEDLLQQTVLLFQEETKNKKIEVVIKSTGKLEIDADQSQLEQALINLISNSIYALENRDNKTIELRSYQKNSQVHIEVWDNGHGIPADNLNHIFVPFYTTRKNGSGIGLSLVKYLIQLNNGSIRVKSVPDKESQFILIFN